MEPAIRGRRTVLAALLACLLAFALPAYGQDPRHSEAQGAAREWLALADANNIGETYGTAAKRFRGVMSAEQWQLAMQRAREQFGATKRRAVMSTQPPKPGADVPPGEFIVILYRSEFEKRPDSTETLTLEREADGKWRVVGYLMR